MLIHHRLLKAALTLVNPDDVRFYLGGVHVRPDGMVEATDGTIAARLIDPHRETDDDQYPDNVPGMMGTPEVSGPVLIPGDIVKAVVAAVPRPKRYGAIPILAHVQIREQAPETPEGSTTYQFVAGHVGQPVLHTTRRVEGQFPAIERVLTPEVDPARATTILGVDKLSLLLACAKALEAKGICLSVPHEQPDLKHERMEARDPLHARITNNEGQTAELVLMPTQEGCERYRACFPPVPATLDVEAVEGTVPTVEPAEPFVYPPVLALQDIVRLLDEQVWNADTPAAIAALLRHAGMVIREPTDA